MIVAGNANTNNNSSAANGNEGKNSVKNQLCDYCQLTVVIPNLNSPANLGRWRKLELAKRQLLAQLRSLQLPPFQANKPINLVPLLAFEFVEKLAQPQFASPIMMGHRDGIITIVAEEADVDYRERARLMLNEPQRTLIGHFRHEIGHYIDFVGINLDRRKQYHELFRDPLSLDYNQAKSNYYNSVQSNNWQGAFVSKYASMHPWEDFAETVDAFLNLAAVMQVASDHGICDVQTAGHLCEPDTLRQYRDIALLSNELNFSRGLGQLVPEIISETVRTKLAFVASLCDVDNSL